MLTGRAFGTIWLKIKTTSIVLKVKVICLDLLLLTKNGECINKCFVLLSASCSMWIDVVLPYIKKGNHCCPLKVVDVKS